MHRSMRRRQPRTDRRRLDILRSAAAAFRRRGYHGASVDEIARALRMTKGNLYYYFRNKEEILFACHRHSLDLLLAMLDEVSSADAPPDAKLHRLVAAFVDTIVHELHGTALVMDLQPLRPAHLREVVAKRDRFERGIRRLIREGMNQGVFARRDPKLVAFAMLGAVNWIPRWFDPGGAAPSEDISRVFADYLVSGLAAR